MKFAASSGRNVEVDDNALAGGGGVVLGGGGGGGGEDLLELFELPRGVVLLLPRVVQVTQGFRQVAHRPVPLPPQVIAQRPEDTRVGRYVTLC